MSKSSQAKKKQKPILEFKKAYYYLSNFYLCEIRYAGRNHPSAEHAFQSAKAVPGDTHDYDWVASAQSPGEAKRRGRQITCRRDWEDIKVSVMKQVVKAKFTQNHSLRQQLLSTGTRHLEEGNNHGDTFWGTVNGEGENMLGKILMEVRKEVRNASV